MGLLENTSKEICYTSSITLPTFGNSRQLSSVMNTQVYYSSAEENPPKYFQSDEPMKTCPIHRCINWLSDNKSNVTRIPSDIVSDYQNRSQIAYRNDNVYESSTNLKRAVNLLKSKDIYETDIEKLYERKEENKKKMKPTDFVGMNKKILLLRLNYNTNRPCCNSNVQKVKSEELNEREIPQYMRNHLQRSYTHDYDQIQREGSKTTKSKSADSDSFNNNDPDKGYLKKINKSYRKEQSEDSSEDSFSNYEQLRRSRGYPRKSTLRKNYTVDKNLYEGKTLKEFVEFYSKLYHTKEVLRNDFPICFEIYFYSYPSQADNYLLLFQRHGLRTLAKYMDPFDANQLVVDLKADFLFDRRIEMIETQCNCQIIMEPLSLKFVNGLPHRLMKIYSTNYENISKALSIMEETLPHIMKTAVLKTKLPCIYPSKWSCKDSFIFRPFRSVRPEVGCASWSSRIKPEKRFPSVRCLLNRSLQNISKNSYLSITSKGNTEESRDKKVSINRRASLQIKIDSSITSLDRKSVASVTVENYESKIHAGNNASVNISNQENKIDQLSSLNKLIVIPSSSLTRSPSNKKSFQFSHLKRIKCPESVLKHKIFSDQNTLQFLSAKYQCNLIKIESMNQNVLSDHKGQIKLTILYNSREQLRHFCKTFGLRMKLK